MKLLQLPSILLLAAAGLFAIPLDTEARDRDDHHHSDHDRDNHHHDRFYGHYDDHRYYGHDEHRYYGGHYYGHPYGYGYGYGYPYYGPRFGVSFYSSPSYAYRSYGYDDDTAVDVQRALRRRGYYHGLIDGDVGPGTRSAIYAYQVDHGLPASGRIDSPLLRSLGV